MILHFLAVDNSIYLGCCDHSFEQTKGEKDSQIQNDFTFLIDSLISDGALFWSYPAWIKA